MIASLAANPKRKFIFVEIAFFSRFVGHFFLITQRWWREQDDETKAITKQLIANGQLEFINAGTLFYPMQVTQGWVMNDEAAVTATDVIDQMTLGHDFIFNEFGFVPTVGWHIGNISTRKIIPRPFWTFCE